MRNLRLLLWDECNRACAGCCNKDWNTKMLPEFSLGQAPLFDLIMLTGGEPMLHPPKVVSIIEKIRPHMAPGTKLIMYTAYAGVATAIMLRDHLDGVTLTLHEPEDTILFRLLQTYMLQKELHAGKSLRLNIFKGVEVPADVRGWEVKKDIEWIANCPLPADEVFMSWCSSEKCPDCGAELKGHWSGVVCSELCGYEYCI